MPSSDATRLLQRLGEGSPDAEAELAPLVYAELRRLAAGALARMGNGHTLQPTALVHEAWMRLVRADDAGYRGREHFLAVAARAMRSVLVDHARRRSVHSPGRAAATDELDQVVLELESRSVDLIALDDALTELADVDPALVDVVVLRFYGGLTHAEIAASQGMSLRSVERGWRTARAWLSSRLPEDER